jgi:hypothetical protein
MSRKVKKPSNLKTSVSQDIRSALRAFIMAHKDGWEKESLKDLKIYLQAYHGYNKSIKTIEALLVDEMRSIGVEMKALHIEEDLFSSTKAERKIKLGSCFCPDCSRFKNYKKECPHCGFHEMTV